MQVRHYPVTVSDEVRPFATGENSGKAAAADDAQSQETGPARTSEGKNYVLTFAPINVG